MLSRHEEKYIIDYRQYALLRERALRLLSPDPNGQNGSYVITSLYYDDFLDHALDEKLDGLAEHTKFRIRTYDYSDQVIKLDRAAADSSSGGRAYASGRLLRKSRRAGRPGAGRRFAEGGGRPLPPGCLLLCRH